MAVAATARRGEAAGWSRWPARWTGGFPALAAIAGTALRAALVAALALRGIAALALISWGAWQAYEPAGPIVAGLLLLADRMHDERREPK